MCLLPNIFVETMVQFFLMILCWMERTLIDFFCDSVYLSTVRFDQFNVNYSLICILNKSGKPMTHKESHYLISE